MLVKIYLLQKADSRVSIWYLKGESRFDCLLNTDLRVVTRDLYSIVDGLDECIKDFKLLRKSTADERMEGFLKRLYSIV